MNLHELTTIVTLAGFKIHDNGVQIYKAGNSRTQSQTYYEPGTANPDLATMDEMKGYCSYVMDEIVKESHEGKYVTVDIRLQPNLTLN